jgi:hypothetical protein
MKIKTITIIIICFNLSSCASLNSQPKIQSKVFSKDSLTAIETSQGSKVAYIHAGDDREIFCLAPGSDFAFSQSGGDSITASDSGASLGIGASESAGVAELGGINSGVLLSRDVMYRTCEFMANLKAINGLTAEIAIELFQNSLKAVQQFSSDYKQSTETGQATNTVTTSESKQ